MEKKKNNKGNAVLAVMLSLSLALSGVMTYQYGKTKSSLKEYQSKVIMEELEVEPIHISHSVSDVYTETYQNEVEQKLNDLKMTTDCTFNNPLVVENPYGTYTTALYYYARTETPSYMECRVVSEGASTIKHRLVSVTGEDLVTEHEYQIIGLVPGQENIITLKAYDANDKVISKTKFIVAPAEDKEIPQVLEVKNGDSEVEMSDGLYALFGHDKATAVNIYLYDNEGVSRGRMPLNEYRTDRFMFADQYMAFSYDINKIALMNRLGKIVKTFDVGNYEFHHDFIYDETHNCILSLANDTTADTIEDRLIALNLETGEVKELIDFVNYLPEMRKSAVQREGGKNTYGGTELDWLHLNSLDLIGDGEAIFSSREQSALIKMSDIYSEEPKMDYIIHSGSVYKDTPYESLLLTKKGDFVGQAGQHTITVEHDDTLAEGQYYLYMFNNNFGNAATIPSFDWSLYPGVGAFAKGDHSSYYKYLVDENAGTYELVKDIHLPYSSIVSSVQHLGGNIPFSSGMSKCFGEYDTEGKMIRTFAYEADKYSYRVMKYDFAGFYYR